MLIEEFDNGIVRISADDDGPDFGIDLAELLKGFEASHASADGQVEHDLGERSACCIRPGRSG